MIKSYKITPPPLHVYSVFDPIYRINFYITWSQHKGRIEEFVNRQAYQMYRTPAIKMGTCIPLHLDGGNFAIVLAFPFEYEGTPDQLNTVNHEVSHAVFTMFKYRSIPLPKDGDYNTNDEEGFCYYSGWLTSHIIDAFQNKEQHIFSFDEEKEIKN